MRLLRCDDKVLARLLLPHGFSLLISVYRVLVFGQLAHQERAFLNRLGVVELQMALLAPGLLALEVKVGIMWTVGLIHD